MVTPNNQYGLEPGVTWEDGYLHEMSVLRARRLPVAGRLFGRW